MSMKRLREFRREREEAGAVPSQVPYDGCLHSPHNSVLLDRVGALDVTTVHVRPPDAQKEREEAGSGATQVP